MPIAPDSSAPVPTRTVKPPKKKSIPKNFVGPIAPSVAAGPTRVSRAVKPAPRVMGPVAPNLQSPIPSYTSAIFKRKAPIIPKADFSPDTPKSSNDLSGFIRGLKEKNKQDFYADTPVNSELTEAGPTGLDFLLNSERTREEIGYKEDYGRNEQLQNFLKKVMPENYDPEYGGPALPEAWKHYKNDPSKPLKPHWDAREIASNLSDFEPGSSFAQRAMNDIIYAQMMNRQNWTKRQTESRAYRLSETLTDAADAARKGDFNYLADEVKDHPNLMEPFSKYKDDFTTGPDEIWDQWTKVRNSYNGDDYLKGAMREKTDIVRGHYKFVQQHYATSQSVSARAIRQYEKKYNKSVEYAEDRGGKRAALAKAAGPAIPVPKNTDKTLVDAAGLANPERKSSEDQPWSDRQEIKKTLGIDKLPTVKEMLTHMVSAGQIDPDDDGDLDAWIDRLQNPNHPDTRAVYALYAKAINPKFNLKKEGIEFINEPIKNYGTQQELEQKKHVATVLRTQGIANKSVLPYVMKLAKEPWNAFDTKDTAENIVETVNEVGAVEDDTASHNSLQALGWTIDKLMRFNYAYAATTEGINRLDKDKSTGADPWYVMANPISVLSGKNLSDSIDEVWADPTLVAGPAKAAYKQFFRGSGFKGTSDDTIPITFSQVIANNALWDPEDNIYDQEWYQHVGGFILDAGTDPLNFSGMNIVPAALKVPVRVAKSIKPGLAEDAVSSPAKFLLELNAPHLSPQAEHVWRVNQAMARKGELAEGDALVTEGGLTPAKFTVEYSPTSNFAPVGDASVAPRYSNARYFADQKEQRLQIKSEMDQLAALKNHYPTEVALASHTKEIQKIVDDLDLGDGNIISVPEVRSSVLLADNASPLRMEGVGNANPLSRPGGRFWDRVINPLEDAAAKAPGRKSKTRYRAFTDESGTTRLTQKAAAARRAIDEEDMLHKFNSSTEMRDPLVMNASAERWQKALDEAGDIDPNTGKPSMWQEYDVEHFLDEGAPGLIMPGGWSPLKAYAKASGLTPEEFSKFWSEADVIRSLVRGPKQLRKSDPVYEAEYLEATRKISDAEKKLETATDPVARTSAYRSKAIGIEKVNKLTFDASFRYLEGMRQGIVHEGVVTDTSHLDALIGKADAALEKSYRDVDDIPTYSNAIELNPVNKKLQITQNNLDGTYDDFDFEGKSFAQALEEADPSRFSSKSAQITSMLDELQAQKTTFGSSGKSATMEFGLSEANVIELNNILPLSSSFRKANGSFDADAISAALTHNKKNMSKDNPNVFRVTFRNQASDGDNKFLGMLAKAIEDKADTLFSKGKTEIVNAKPKSKTQSTDADAVEDQIATFWTKGKEGREGPAVRNLGPKPTEDSVREAFPNTFAAEKSKSAEHLSKTIAYKDVKQVPTIKGQHIGDNPLDDATQANVKYNFGKATNKSASQRRIDAVLKGKIRQWEKGRKTAQETDAAKIKSLRAELSKARANNAEFKLTAQETQNLYNSTFAEAKKLVIEDVVVSKKLMASGGNARLAVGDATADMHRQAATMIKYEELQLKIAKAEATLPDELRALEVRRKQLIKKKIALYERVKKAKYESNTVRLTMMHRIGEEHIAQALMMPLRLEGRVVQLQIMGMRKNLQFTSSMFKGAEYAEKFLPAAVWSKYQDTWVRPSKRVKTKESIEMRAMREGKTPVLVHANLKKLTHAMANTTESERGGMLMAHRKGIPYGGPKQTEYQNVIEAMDEVLDILNGVHMKHITKRVGKATADPTELREILRFIPSEYAFNIKALDNAILNRGLPALSSEKRKAGAPAGWRKDMRTDDEKAAWIDLHDIAEDLPISSKQLSYLDDLGADANRVSNLENNSQISSYIEELQGAKSSVKSAAAQQNLDPFGPMPEARNAYTIDDLMNAIESNGLASPKDISDPFRVAWVYNLAADQATSLRAYKKTIGETFGVVRPTSPDKIQMWNKLSTEHGWSGNDEFEGVLFPPEMAKEVDTLMKFTVPGPEHTKFVKMMDQAIGTWKQGMTIYNPAYYTRNGIGEVMVSWLDGVTDPRWYRRAGRISKYLKHNDHDIATLLAKYDVLEGKIPVDIAKGNEVLFSLKGGLKVRIEDTLKEYVDHGLMSTFARTDIGTGVRGLSNQSLGGSKARKGLAKVNNKVHEKGEGFEDYLRLAHFMHAMEHSGKGSLKEAADYAATRVRRSHFDYTDFSDMEKALMLRAFPFYKWTRRGAPLMMQHLFMTPGKMSAAPKAMDAMSGLGVDPINAFNEGPVFDTQDVYEDKNGNLPNYTGIAPSFIRDLFAYQMQPAADDEYANFFRVSLPQFDGLQGMLSLVSGDFGSSPAYTLMNPAVKMAAELAQNKSLNSDNPYEIVGGEYNENMGINGTEAVGAYAARNINPWLGFLAKLSKNGKLPFGNISDQESGRDATRDVASFISGMGFYQTKLGYDGEVPESPPAVGQLSSGDLPVLSGLAALNRPSKKDKPNKNDEAVKKLLKAASGTTSGEDVTGDDATGWIEGKYDNKGKKKSGWIPNKYGKDKYEKGSGGYSGGYSGGSGGYSGGSSGSSGVWALLELLKRLRSETDQGKVTDTSVFSQDQ